MKNVQLLVSSVLLSIAVACGGASEPSDGESGQKTSPVSGDPADSDPKDPPAPAPTPARPPAPACAPLAQPGGGPGIGMANPASVYCAALGNTSQPDGKCGFSDGTSCDEWAFYRGECGQAHSFCNLHGGSVSNKIEDMGGWTASYALCTLSGKACQETTFARTCSCE